MKILRREDFKELYLARFDSVRRFIFYKCSDTDVASDIAQEVFVKIWEKNINIDPVKDINLLFKIARDLYIDKVRRDKVALNFTETIEPVNMIDDAENEINYKVLSKAYNEALVQMTESQREAFLLNRNDGLKYNEISKQLGITVKAVEKRISGALSILKRTIL